jgi:AraC-like DNA-binding protein
MARLQQPQASRRRYRGDYEAHAHEHAQLLFGLSGSLELELDGRPARVEPGTAVVVPAGVAHGYGTRHAALALVVDAPAGPGLDRVRSVAIDPRLLQAHEHEPAVLLAALQAAPRVLQRRALDLDALAQAVDTSLHADWSTPRLAALCALSAPRFHARLRAQTGQTPQDWLRMRRLQRAQALLAAGLTLDATATRVGYASASALAHALRREQGVRVRALRAALSRP